MNVHIQVHSHVHVYIHMHEKKRKKKGERGSAQPQQMPRMDSEFRHMFRVIEMHGKKCEVKSWEKLIHSQNC